MGEILMSGGARVCPALPSSPEISIYQLQTSLVAVFPLELALTQHVDQHYSHLYPHWPAVH